MLCSKHRMEEIMSNIILIGMPGVGKSTAGVVLAKLLGYQFVDADLLIQQEENRLLSQIIEQEGVEEFLNIECRVNSSINVDKTVIATGGSVVYKEKAMKHLRDIGKVVYLELSYKQLDKRLSNIKGRGVVLREGQTLKTLYDERVPLYKKYAHIIVNEEGLGVEETICEIEKELFMNY